MTSLLEEFLSDGEGLFMAQRVLDAVGTNPAGTEYLTFNAWNVRLDMEAQTATIEDELDADRELVVPLPELVDRLRQRVRRSRP